MHQESFALLKVSKAIRPLWGVNPRIPACLPDCQIASFPTGLSPQKSLRAPSLCHDSEIIFCGYHLVPQLGTAIDHPSWQIANECQEKQHQQ